MLSMDFTGTWEGKRIFLNKTTEKIYKHYY